MAGKKRYTPEQLIQKIDEAKILAAQTLIRQIRTAGVVRCLTDIEFKVFSQFGDDGIIQYLIHHLDLPHSFVEFGVEDYTEANTRFLLVNDNWRGLVMDGSRKHVQSIRHEDIYWRHDLTAVCSFIDRENINSLGQVLIESSGIIACLLARCECIERTAKTLDILRDFVSCAFLRALEMHVLNQMGNAELPLGLVA